ncbi:hypothetical protein [Jeotgalibaca arthritidis]|uniref:hypothetical protein n=1 Tax=Jeotgalibaca arthritidis TaxID=1868794 RepID=UPI00359FCA4D
MNYKKTEADYLEELNEQTELLIDYCLQLDKGKTSYSKPLATLIRVLIQDGKFKSLFTLLGKKDSIRYCSTAGNYSDCDDILYLLTLITVIDMQIIENDKLKGYEKIFVPMLNSGKVNKRWIAFDDWYKSPVLIYNKESNDGLIKLEKTQESLLIKNRYDIINYFANKGGGAHVSEKVNKDMFELEKGLASMEYVDVQDMTTLNNGDKHIPGVPIGNSLHAALRQIGHEMIYTIRKGFNIRKSYNPSHKNLIGYKLAGLPERCVRYNSETREMSISN